MIIGHQPQWQYLRRLAEQDKLPHALLFYGQEKLGKRTFAFEFVKWLFGSDIEKKPHPDFIFVGPEEKHPEPERSSVRGSPVPSSALVRGEIKISQIRDLIWRMSLKPSLASLKAAIINQAHCLNQEAQNCFLKTLEEPKGKTLLILVSEYPEMLFDTILSRVQKIRFCPPTSAEIENYLKEKKLGEKERKEILEICGRKPGLVIDLAVNPQKLKQRREKIRELTEIAKSDLALRFQYARTMSENPRDVKEILDIWLSYFRKIFLEQCSIPDVKKMERIRDTIKSTQNTIFLLSSTNVNPRLALENLMLEI